MNRYVSEDHSVETFVVCLESRLVEHCHICSGSVELGSVGRRTSEADETNSNQTTHECLHGLGSGSEKERHHEHVDGEQRSTE